MSRPRTSRHLHGRCTAAGLETTVRLNRNSLHDMPSGAEARGATQLVRWFNRRHMAHLLFILLASLLGNCWIYACEIAPQANTC